MMNRPLRT